MPIDTIVAPQQPTEQPATEQPKAPEAKQVDPNNERLLQLARKEKALRARERALQERESQFKAPEPKVEAPQAPEWQSRFKQDLLGMAREAGMSREEIAQILLSEQQGGSSDYELQVLKRELESLKKGQKDTLTAVEQQQKQAYDQAVKQVTRDVNSLVDSNPDTYETIKATGNQSAVVALIELTYKEDGVLLSADEAAQQVEDHLAEQAFNLASLKKVKAKLNPPAEQAPKQSIPSKQPIPTLSQSMKTTSSSAADRRARAIAIFKGELK